MRLLYHPLCCGCSVVVVALFAFFNKFIVTDQYIYVCVIAGIIAVL